MKKGGFSAFLFFVIIISTFQSIAQSDSTFQSTYFLEQNALPSKKGSLIYNNYYVVANSITYNLTDRLKVSTGIILIPQRPPFYASIQYIVPIAEKIFVSGSLGYYQLKYTKNESSQVFFPQLIVSTGNQNVNTSFSAGVVRGKFLFGGGLLFPSAINLPNRVNLILSLSHRRPLTRTLSFITQNAYISSEAPLGSLYSEILIFSLGGAWQEKRSALKVGVSGVYFTKSESGKPSTYLPFLGFSYLIR